MAERAGEPVQDEGESSAIKVDDASMAILVARLAGLLGGLTLREQHMSLYELDHYARGYPLLDYMGHKATILEYLADPKLATLQRFMRGRNREFNLAVTFEAEFIDAVCYSGCFPMAQTICGEPVMLVKLHQRRCIMADIATRLHVPKKTRKLSRRYEVTLGSAFDQVVANVWEQHGQNWLFPVLARSFKQIHEANGSGQFRAQVHSMEVWREGVLVAGELGFTIGGVYNSLTGFSKESNAGSVQLAALGRLLAHCGFQHWDLGMPMKYKEGLGAEAYPRAKFIEAHVAARDKSTTFALPGERVNARDIIDGTMGAAE